MSADARVASPWYRSLRPRVQAGHEVQLLECGGEFFPALLTAIDQATDSIFVESYIFEDDETGRRIADALARAADRGVRVHLVVDGFGTPKLGGEVASRLAASEVFVETFRPEPRIFRFDRQRLRRLHRKLAVFDGRVAFVGGLNMIDDLRDPNHGALEFPRLDFAVRVRGPIVAHVHLAAQRMWWELTIVNQTLPVAARALKEKLKLPDSVVSDVGEAGDIRAAFMLRDNFRFRRTIEKAYLDAIHRARSEVLIANAYFFPGVRFRGALLDARRRGVRVRLLLQGLVEYRLQHYACQALYDELLLGGIEIFEYRKSFLHAKVAVIDDWATVGSSNIDPFSLLLAREANVNVHDRRFALALRGRLENAIRDGGVAIRLHHHQRRPWPVRLLNRFAFMMLRIAVSLTGRAARY